MRENLKSLSNAVFLGEVQTAKDLAIKMLKPYVNQIKTDHTGSVFAAIKGKSDYTLMLQAHIDEVGFMVTAVLENGFLRVDKVGGADVRTLPGSSVIIHGKRDITGIFSTTPPHLADEKEGGDKLPGMDKLLVDTGLKNAGEFVSVGDFVSFNTKAKELENGCITGKSLDNRAACCALVDVARRISEDGEPPINILIFLSSGEELGQRGAQVGAYNSGADAAIAIDVTFARSHGAPTEKCFSLGGGAVLEISPILDKEILCKLKNTAEKHNIPHQLSVLPGRTSTDVDVLTINQSGMKCGLVSIPLRYMHTAVELVNMADIAAVCDLIFEAVKEWEDA